MKDKSLRIIAVAVVMMMTFLFSALIVQAGTPVHNAPDVLVKGPNEVFHVTISVESHENASYHVEISDIETVTLKFDLLGNGSSEIKKLADGIQYNFTVPLKSLDASAGETAKVPYEVYQNDVLVAQGKVNIQVENPQPTTPGGLDCSVCGGIIPLMIVGGLLIVHKRKLIKNTG